MRQNKLRHLLSLCEGYTSNNVELVTLFLLVAGRQ
jgi:hypothetical protein